MRRGHLRLPRSVVSWRLQVIPHGEGPWLPQQLTLVAFYYRPDLEVVRDEVNVAQAAVYTARVRPAVGTDLIPEKAARPDEGRSSTWTVEFGVDVAVETGGKRGARVARARAAVIAARLDVAVRSWDIAGDVADAATAVVNADSMFVAASAVVEGANRVLEQLQRRYERGEIGSTELARSATDVADANITVTQANRARVDARAALARLLGVSPTQVAGLAVAPIPSACTLVDSVVVDSLRSRALRTRAEVGVSLAHYLASEANLQLAIADQYPDVEIGPAFLWDEGIARWIVALALPDVVLAHARGPIAEARARRTAEAARVVVVQDSVLAEVDAAVAHCRVAEVGLLATDSLTRAVEQSLATTQRSYERGETGAEAVAFAVLATRQAVRAVWDARGRVDAAGVALQRAIGSWLTGPEVSWPDLGLPLQRGDPAS